MSIYNSIIWINDDIPQHLMLHSSFCQLLNKRIMLAQINFEHLQLFYLSYLCCSTLLSSKQIGYMLIMNVTKTLWVLCVNIQFASNSFSYNLNLCFFYNSYLLFAFISLGNNLFDTFFTYLAYTYTYIYVYVVPFLIIQHTKYTTTRMEVQTQILPFTNCKITRW